MFIISLIWITEYNYILFNNDYYIIMHSCIIYWVMGWLLNNFTVVENQAIIFIF